MNVTRRATRLGRLLAVSRRVGSLLLRGYRWVIGAFADSGSVVIASHGVAGWEPEMPVAESQVMLHEGRGAGKAATEGSGPDRWPDG